MSELQEIEVVISAEGLVNIRVQGVAGPKCLTLTKDVEALLGDQITDRTLTDEYDQECQEIEKSVLLDLKRP